MLASMIARIAEHEKRAADLDPQYVARHRAFIASQPGFCGGYHLLDAETGRAVSLTMWETDDALAAAERAMRAGEAPADGRISRQSNPTVRVVHVEAVF
jgi:heme-degrading monooxygenase HmoA